jgi:membrane protease YdiL (CAAX protease family)
MMIGAARLVAETWLRLNLGVHRIRSIQGMSALLMTLLFFAVVAGAAQRPAAAWFTDLLLAAPPALRNLPIAWPVTLIDRPAVAFLLCAVVALAATGLAIEATTWMLRHGTTRSEGATPRARGGARWTKPGEARGLWRGVLGKDLRLLLRDRNFLVSTLIVPVVMIALQLFLNRRMGTRLGRSSGQWDATAAYVGGSYALTTGCFRILSGEGRSLWLLFAQPVEIATALRHKVRLWLGLGLTFGLGTLAALTAMHGVTDGWRLASDVAFVGLGIWLAGHLAGGIAALAANPATDHIKPGVGARFAYLYLFLAGTYTAGLQSPALTARLTAVVVFGTMVAALWFRIRERMPYLLDPEAPPDRNLSLYDAALAALTFFIVQVLAAMVLHFSAGRETIDPVGSALRAFATAGAVTLTLFSLVLKLRGIALRDAFALRPPSWGRAGGGVVVGAIAGAALGCAGLAWAKFALQQGWLDVSAQPETTIEQRTYLLWLGVVAAPLCEEALFRGMLFQSMATVLRTPIAAVWSAAVFAACHPPAAWLPVFSLGVLAALLLARTRFLPAAIAAHAAYNAVVLLQPWG